MPLKVLHVITRYRFGGSEARLRDAVAALRDAEHTVIVGLDSDLEHAARGLPGAHIVALPTLVRRPDPVRDRRTLRSLALAIEREQPDVVFTHQSKAGVLGRVAAARGEPRPAAIHSLSMASFGPGYPPWQDATFRRIETQMHPRTSAFAVVGADLVSRYRSIGVPASKLRVIRSGVPLPTPISDAERDGVRARVGVPAGRPLLLSLGSLEPRKHVLSLVPLLTGLHRRTVTQRPFLTVAGEGQQREVLRERVRRAGLERDVAILGHIRDPRPLLAAADAVILLSDVEGLPQVLVQAAAAGTPFVAYDVDGVRELIRLGASGVCVPPGDLHGAIAATVGVLAVGCRAAPRIDLRTWEPSTIAGAYRELFASLTTRSERAGAVQGV